MTTASVLAGIRGIFFTGLGMCCKRSKYDYIRVTHHIVYSSLNNNNWFRCHQFSLVGNSSKTVLLPTKPPCTKPDIIKQTCTIPYIYVSRATIYIFFRDHLHPYKYYKIIVWLIFCCTSDAATQATSPASRGLSSSVERLA